MKTLRGTTKEMIGMNIKHLEEGAKMTEASTKEEEDIMDAEEGALMTINTKKIETTATFEKKMEAGQMTTTTKMIAAEVATTPEDISIDAARMAAEEETTPGRTKIKTNTTEAAMTTEDRENPLKTERIDTNPGSTIGTKITSTKMNSTISRSTTEVMMIMSNLPGITITTFLQGSRTATKPTAIMMLPWIIREIHP